MAALLHDAWPLRVAVRGRSSRPVLGAELALAAGVLQADP